jgi:DNA adenine methylase
MKTIQSKIRNIKTHGGKSYLAKRIIQHLPEHRFYVEPCAGGLGVLLNKPPCSVEVVSDLDAGLIGYYRVLKNRPDEFLDRLSNVRYDVETFEWALKSEVPSDPLEAAVVFLVRRRFSRGGMGKSFAWSNRLRGRQPGDVNGWETFKQGLPRLARRLRHVELLHQDALEVIRAHDGPETLFYLDPPYLHSTRTAKKVYDHEMSDLDHAQLLDVITHCRGMVAISGYPNPLYDAALVGWERVEFSMRNHAGQSRSKQWRIEVLWLNPNCREAPFALVGA